MSNKLPRIDDLNGKRSGSPVFRSIVFACFFLSGAAGLIYEVVWARQLGLFLGITSIAHTAVITAYMAGLAAGSLFFGRRADQGTNPLRLYAWLEIGVGVYAALTPWLLDRLQTGYATIAGVTGISGMPGHLVRFSIALLALLIPTFLMGGTLPLLVRGFVQSLPELGTTISRLYGLNTLGAMTGTLLAGYFLLPVYGIQVSILTGVGLNLGIAALVLLMLRFQVQTVAQKGQAPAAQSRANHHHAHHANALTAGTRVSILLAFGLAGFAALLTQLAWIRALILVVGGSVYAFTITLASFLAGIGLGSLFYARFLSSPGMKTGDALTQRRLVQAAALAGLIGFLILLGLPLIGKLPGWFLAGYSAGLQVKFAVFQVFIFSLCFTIMFLPCLLMGALFPLVTVIWTRSSAQAGQGTGAVYAINTFGTIFGALLGGLLILPWLGIHRSLLATASLYILVSGVFWWPGGRGFTHASRITVALVAVVVFGLAVSRVPPWNQALMASGVFFLPETLSERTKNTTLEEAVMANELLYYQEGLDGTVTVTRNPVQKFLRINGKTDASSVGDLPTQVLLGQIPLMVHPGASDVLIIGLGSGVTAGSVATHAEIENITVLEISREVIDASSFFEGENGRVLSDPRLTLVNADARNYLLATEQKFDVIVSEPSNPWISGISNLFTYEFFSLVKKHLAADGLMSQWLHSYGLSEADLKTVLKTYNEVFPEVSIWYTLAGDWVLIGSMTPHSLDAEHILKLFQIPAISIDLERVSVSDTRDLVRHFIMDRAAVERFVAGAGINSDGHPVIEFNAPRYLYRETTQSNLLAMTEHMVENTLSIPIINMVKKSAGELDVLSMALLIKLKPDVEVKSLHSSWLLSRRTVESVDSMGLGMGSTRQIQWLEGQREFRVQAILQESIHEAQDQAAFDRAMQSQEIRQGGKINMFGGHAGRWMLGGGAGQRVELIVSWHCPANGGGFTRYAMHAILPDTGEQAPDETLVELADRFRCYLPAAIESDRSH